MAFDMDYPDLQAMIKMDERLGQASDFTRKQIIQEAKRVVEEFEILGGHRSLKSGRLKKLWDECSPESWWPEDREHPVRAEVAKMIAILMGSFPTSKIPEPEIFVPALLDDVMALDPTFVEMEATCRHLRKTKKFMPSISEVIETLEEQKVLWDRRSDAVWFMEEWYDDLCAEIARAKAAEDRKAAKSEPLVVGDRVRNSKLGSGTVTAVEQLEFEEGMLYRVCFDISPETDLFGSTLFGAKNLERLVAGDEGFEPPAVSMIGQRNDAPMPPIASATVPLDGVRVARTKGNDEGD